MIKAMRVQNTVICVINNKMYKKTCQTSEEILELYELAMSTDEYDPEGILHLIDKLSPPKSREEEELEAKIAEAAEQQSLMDWINNIKNLGDEHFEVVGLKLYLKGINITVPEFIAVEFAKRKDNKEDLDALMNFWRLCALNPDPRCREDLYKFLINNKLTVTPSGYFVAYRNVNIKNHGDYAKNVTINNEWTRIKAKKKIPFNYYLIWEYDCDIEDYSYRAMKIAKFHKLQENNVDFDAEIVGNLGDLYTELQTAISGNPSETVYTDQYTGTFEIRLGQPVKMDRRKCNANPDETCSRGLHMANSSWLSKGYFGVVGIAGLVNPMHVVAVPYTDGGKLRCCEYLPICTIEYDENGNVIPIETETFEIDYAELTQTELDALIERSNIESLKEHEIIPKELDVISLRNAIGGIKESLETMTEVVRNRVTNV